ncbi:MAG: class I SAM-dependent RNA methyltransferase [Deltaproteobacteria bacterium]|nr:class I SAM-dependent RNA methyltransferase [Deltaproteobacteria bacterium]
MIEEIKEGDVLRADISTVAFGGDGVARIGNLVAFVPFTVDGDVVDVAVTAVRKNFIRGALKKVVEPSPYRVEPECKYYSICGGCQYQHISYGHQIAIKEKQVRESFQRIGKLSDMPAREIRQSPAAYHYRGKAEFHCDLMQKKIGFMDVGGGVLIDIENCSLMDESINQELEKLRLKMQSEDMDRPSGRRYAFWSGTPYMAVSYVTRRIMDRDLRVPYRGFFQANTVLTEKLLESVISMIEPSSSEVILDCYCGSGLFALFLAERARKVFGIEIDKRAVDCARHNLKYNGYKNCEFLKGSVVDVLQKRFIRDHIHIDSVLLDPPREGCSQGVLEGLSRLKPSRLVYVSCNPATQARDIKYLMEQGFFLKMLEPIDMFPQTRHIEVIALMTYGKED